MDYFNIVHVIVLVIILFIFAGLMFLIRNEKNPKVLITMVVSIISACLILAIFSMYVIDNATKKAVIDNIAQKRVLMNETIVFSGQIRNTGSFAIGTCKLEIKLINNPLNAGNLSSSNLFNPMNLFKSNNDDPAQKSSTVKQDFVVAKNIKSGEIRNFSVSMRYPSHFSQSSTIQKLNCY